MPKASNSMKSAANETYGKDHFREGGFAEEIYDSGTSHMIDIGSVYRNNEPFGASNLLGSDHGPYYRDIAVFNASDALINYMKRAYGATVTQSGARTEFHFRGNTGSGTGIGNNVAIRQAMHLVGFKRFNDAWRYSTKQEINDLFGAEKEKWSK